MRDQQGGGLIVVAAGLLCLVLVASGFMFWQWQRMVTMKRAAVAARIEALQQQALAEQALAQRESTREELAGGMHTEIDSDLALAGVSAQSNVVSSDTDETAAILAVLDAQQSAWNAGDIEEFMETYWKSEDLTFSSGGETTRSWQQTLDRYKKKYSTREAMGELEFRDLKVHLLSSQAAYVLGRWELQGLSGGNFTLVMRKLENGWVIVHDHTSVNEDNSESPDEEGTTD